MALAPIYDCGSALYPQVDESLAKKILSSKTEMKARVFEIPTSSINLNGRRINYQKFIASHSYEECDQALKRIVPRINMVGIASLIEETEIGADAIKEFLIKILKLRKQLILDDNLGMCFIP